MIAAIDIETTGLDPNKHQILSIGAVLENGKEFYRDVVWNEYTVSPQALKVKEINLATHTGYYLSDALVSLHYFLGNEYDIINVNFNPVFNNSFLKCKWLHYRTIDLNTIIRFFCLNKKDLVERFLIGQRHNALDDARLAMKIYQYLVNNFAKERE